DYNKSFEVQFNPSTLNISGFSGGSYELVDYSGKGAGAKTTPLHPNLSLNVTLVFDQMDLSNSFPMDSIDFSISANAMKAMKAVQGMTNYMPISVQAATEGLVAALSNQYTRLVCFAWGKQIRYKGVLKSVNANYKLFDIMGRPVRSEVALSIYLADKDVMAAGGESKLGIWKEAYDEAFDDAIGYGKTATDTYKKVSETIFG
ncbi:MAG: hypothetical protein J6N76_06390, partial [Lachnospiraceae bacterium]|nr:hypothetical protein [Lachnospiraceae bacterium]